MAQKYLDESGLAYFWQKVKAYGNSHWSGSASGTSVPTADTIAEFDSTAHMNSTDMTATEVSDFVDSLAPHGVDGSFPIRKLLWSDSASTSFSAQTVSLSLSDYDEVEVYFDGGGMYDVLLPNPLIVPIGEFRNVLLLHGVGSSGVNENTGARLITASTNGVTFGNYAYKNRRSGGTLTVSNGFAVPRKIYGIKYV